jgi:5-methylcytosine-specific restriction endonuclease McrA
MPRRRREFPTKVRVAVIKRAMRGNVVYCELCGGIARRFQIDHVIADAHGGEPEIENAQLLCEVCFGEKNPKDTTIAAKLKRIEARHVGATLPKQKLKGRGFGKRQKSPAIDKSALFPLPRRVCGVLVSE